MRRGHQHLLRQDCREHRQRVDAGIEHAVTRPAPRSIAGRDATRARLPSRRCSRSREPARRQPCPRRRDPRGETRMPGLEQGAPSAFAPAPREQRDLARSAPAGRFFQQHVFARHRSASTAAAKCACGGVQMATAVELRHAEREHGCEVGAVRRCRSTRALRLAAATSSNCVLARNTGMCWSRAILPTPTRPTRSRRIFFHPRLGAFNSIKAGQAECARNVYGPMHDTHPHGPGAHARSGQHRGHRKESHWA